MTNREMAEKDEGFRALCTTHNVTPTMRQASKYRRKRGLVWARSHGGRA